MLGTLESVFPRLAAALSQDRPGRANPSAPSVSNGQPIDPPALLEHVDGDVTLLRGLVNMFEEESRIMLIQINEALIADDAERLERSAHKLKGAISNFSACAGFNLAARLEASGRERRFEDARETAAELAAEIERIVPALKALLNSVECAEGPSPRTAPRSDRRGDELFD